MKPNSMSRIIPSSRDNDIHEENEIRPVFLISSSSKSDEYIQLDTETRLNISSQIFMILLFLIRLIHNKILGSYSNGYMRQRKASLRETVNDEDSEEY